MNNNYYYNPNIIKQTMPYIKNPIYPNIENQFIKPKLFKNPLTTSKITFSSILNGTSKTLNVINQAIPVMYQIKPIWKNAKTMFKVAKEINKPEKKEINKKLNKELNENINKKEKSGNNPTFFL